MIKRILAVVTALVVITALGYIIWLHPASVEFNIARDQPFRMPLGWLLVFAFVAGTAVALAAASFQRLSRALGRWRVERRDRAASLIASWERTGLALAWDGEVERARSLLLKAWRRAPQNQGAALALASSYMDTGEFHKARQILEAALTHNPSDADVLFALSEALRRSGEKGEAIRMLEAIRVRHPRAPRALVGLRELYRDAGRWHEAAQLQDAYVNSVTLGDRAALEQQRLLDLRYQAAMTATDPSARMAALKKVLEVNYQHIPATAALADTLAATGNLHEAARLLERALKTTACLLIVERLFALHTTPRDRARVLASLRKSPRIAADVVHYLAAQAALEDGNFEAAASELQLVSDREQPAVYRLWADIHRHRGSIREAFNALAQVADSDPTQQGGLVCPECHRVPQPRGSTVPACPYWDGMRQG